MFYLWTRAHIALHSQARIYRLTPRLWLSDAAPHSGSNVCWRATDFDRLQHLA